MGLFKNDVGRPSNETIKKRNIFKGICVLLVIVIIVLVAYILNDKVVFGTNSTKKEDNNNQDITTTKKQTDDDFEELDVKSVEVEKLFNRMNRFTLGLDLIKASGGGNLFTYFYQKDKIYANEVSDDIKFSYSFLELYEEDFEKLYPTVEYNERIKAQKEFVGSVSDVNSQSLKLFGSEFNINNVVYNNTGPAVFGISPIINGDTITVESAGIGDVGSASVYTKIISAKKDQNTIKIVNKAMFVFEGPDENDSFYYGIYKTAKTKIDNCYGHSCYGLENLIKKFPYDNEKTYKDIINKVKIDDYLEQLDSFMWTFTKNAQGNYEFTSVEKVK